MTFIQVFFVRVKFQWKLFLAGEIYWHALVSSPATVIQTYIQCTYRSSDRRKIAKQWILSLHSTWIAWVTWVTLETGFKKHL